MTKIFALGEKHKIDRKIILKPDKVKIIFAWSVPEDQTVVKAFFNTIQSTYCWVLGFTKLTRLLACLIGKVEWK